MRQFIQVIITVLILGGGFVAYSSLKSCESNVFSNKEKAANGKGKGQAGPKQGPARRTPSIKVRTAPLKKSDYIVHIVTQGEVTPHHNTALTSQVSGRVLKISPKFEAGAFFSEGDTLLELETSDFLTDIENAKAQLARAESAYAQEQARAKQALLNWQDAGFTEEPSDLVLRKPQLREASADVASAQSNLNRSERNLERTKIKAPYNGRVRTRAVGIGQQVGANTTLGEIFTTDIAIVRLPITPRYLKYYTPPQPSRASTTQKEQVTFTSIITTQDTPDTWQGDVLRAEGALDDDSRQIFIITRIQDPFGLKTKQPTLYLGQPVRASIPVHTLKDTYVIPRKNLTGLNQIIIIREGKIKHVDIAPVWSTEDEIIFKHDFHPNDLLSTTRLAYAPEGAPVEIIPTDTE